MEATLAQTRAYLEIQLNSEEITQNKQLNKSEREASKHCTQKNQPQHNLSTPAQQNTRHDGQSDPQLTSWREGLTRERLNNSQNPKTYRELT